MNDDARIYGQAFARNHDAIHDVLRHHLPARGIVLEIGSGSGEHCMYFAERSAPDLIFQPTDPNPEARASIDAWRTEKRLANVLPALALDAASTDWPVDFADAVLSINMIHIAPWEAALGLLAGAARVLPQSGMLYLYGPFRRDGGHTAPSNDRFDQDLRGRNPAWGVRDLETVAATAASLGFSPPKVVQMPANNLSVVFRREITVEGE
jgi:SAM-dependent methyltransferase